MKKIKCHIVLPIIILLISQLSTVDVYPQQSGMEIIGDNTSYLNWGYNYDSTLVFLETIGNSPFLKIESIGASLKGRALWMITLKYTLEFSDKYFRITIHARTHPSERQSQWLTQRMVEYLIGNTETAKLLRRHVVFNIVPMYNPDGVELSLARENANGVDLERNWFVPLPEPEVLALRNKYSEFMKDPVPIRIALNMHGAGGTKGYVVYHHEKGTSIPYTIDEKNFISLVRSYWPDGIANWDKFISWTDGTPLVSPDSWFWGNYHESVMALTFEEIPVVSKTDMIIEKTALALLNGIADYLSIGTTLAETESSLPNNFELAQNFPNPFNPSTVIRYSIPYSSNVTIKVYDLLGREIAKLLDEYKNTGSYTINFNSTIGVRELSSGVYFYRIQAGNFIATKKMVLSK